jgi:ribosomal protein S18 acetylase RimI-like enzyme
MESSVHVISRASLADAARIAPLFDAYREFYGQTSDLEGSRAFLEDRIARDESAIFYASSGGDAVDGFIQLYPLFASDRLCRTWVIHDLFVRPDVRRSGCARRLMAAAQQFARESGADAVFLETAKNNLAAQALYESLGYVRETQFYRYDLRLA